MSNGSLVNDVKTCTTKVVSFLVLLKNLKNNLWLFLCPCWFDLFPWAWTSLSYLVNWAMILSVVNAVLENFCLDDKSFWICHYLALISIHVLSRLKSALFFLSLACIWHWSVSCCSYPANLKAFLHELQDRKEQIEKFFLVSFFFLFFLALVIRLRSLLRNRIENEKSQLNLLSGLCLSPVGGKLL